MTRRTSTTKREELYDRWRGGDAILDSVTAALRHVRSRIIRLRRRYTPVRRYVIRSKHEWALIYVDEKHGAFTCHSSFGTYAHTWRSIGDSTLKEFLLDLNFDYFMGKTRPGYRRFEFDQTVEWIKELVRTARRDGSIDKETARKAYEETEYLSSDSMGAFGQSLYDADNLGKVLGHDYSELIRESPDGDSRGFWEIIWPTFRAQISRGRR